MAALAAALRSELAGERGADLLLGAQEFPTAGRVVDALADPAALVLVGCLDDVVVGYARAAVRTLVDGTRVAVVEELGVEPEARAVGVGEALVGEVLAWAADQRCVGVDAPALPGQRATKNFFEAHGFTARLLTVHRPVGP